MLFVNQIKIKLFCVQLEPNLFVASKHVCYLGNLNYPQNCHSFTSALNYFVRILFNKQIFLTINLVSQSGNNKWINKMFTLAPTHRPPPFHTHKYTSYAFFALLSALLISNNSTAWMQGKLQWTSIQLPPCPCVVCFFFQLFLPHCDDPGKSNSNFQHILGGYHFVDTMLLLLGVGYIHSNEFASIWIIFRFLHFSSAYSVSFFSTFYSHFIQYLVILYIC